MTSGAREILVDSGTFTYVGDARERDRFRGSAAHNTVRVDGLDQADPSGPFGWTHPPAVRVLNFQSREAYDFVDAECRYRGIIHHRRVFWIKPDVLWIFDDVSGSPNDDVEHDIEQFWHLGGEPALPGAACFRIPGALLVMESAGVLEIESGWRSRVYGSKISAPVIRVARRESLPSRWAAAVVFGDFDAPASLQRTADGWILNGPRGVTIVLPDSGVPHYN